MLEASPLLIAGAIHCVIDALRQRLFLNRLGIAGLRDLRGLAEPPAQNLLVAGNVVRALNGLDFEAPVLTIAGPPALKDDHRAYRVGPLGIRNVEIGRASCRERV